MKLGDIEGFKELIRAIPETIEWNLKHAKDPRWSCVADACKLLRKSYIEKYMHKIQVFEHDIYSEDRGLIGVYFDELFYEQEKWPVDEYFNPLRLVQDRFSKSFKGGVRGFHGDPKTWKYITALSGRIKVVTWDIKNSVREEFYLEDGDKSILIPPNYLNAHQCLTDTCIFHYKQSEYYETFPANAQYSVNYNDPTINPSWDLEPRRVSKRDKEAVSLSELLGEISP